MLLFAACAGLTALCALIALDLAGKIRLMHPVVIGTALLAVPHSVLLSHLFTRWAGARGIGSVWQTVSLVEAGILFLYLLLRAFIAPVQADPGVAFRVRVLYGGRRLIHLGIWALAAQILLCSFGYPALAPLAVPTYLLVIDGVVTALLVFLLLADGVVRVVCTSKRLNLVMRLVVIFTIWIPIWNIFLLFYCAHKAWEEYDHECYKVVNRQARVDSDLCKTRYPLVMVHGVGFRDLKYFNYWGRIPRELIRNGATVYYGNQEAWGTIEANAADLKQTILRAMEECGRDKVNIIAHSKGGLDSRYMITHFGMAQSVASLTTMSTPHRGCKAVDWAAKMPDKLYQAITRIVNNNFRRLGDKNPDFYRASQQFITSFAEQFNRETPDMPGVYYQSYASVMRGPLSDCILTVPYCAVRPFAPANDGLVDVSSAKWGDFRGVFCNKYRRGISHGDMIDLHRDDYRGFDVVEEYVKIVSELKQRGF